MIFAKPLVGCCGGDCGWIVVLFPWCVRVMIIDVVTRIIGGARMRIARITSPIVLSSPILVLSLVACINK